VPLKVSSFTDPKCEAITGGPGEKELAPGEQTIFICHHVLNKADGEAGVACNVAKVTAEHGSVITQESNTVCAELPERSNFGQEGSCKSVTVTFFGFPKVKGNKVGVVIRVDKKVVVKEKIIFDGSSFSKTYELNLTGKHKVDVFAKWKTNGVHGGGDHNLGFFNCTPEPQFTVEKLQEIAGSGKGFTKEPLAGELAQTVDYEIIVKNTGNVPLKFNGGFVDPNCDSGTTSGGPGAAAVAPGESTTYLCSRLLKEGGANSNTASDTGTPTEGSPVTHESNTVVVNVLVEVAFTIEKFQSIGANTPTKGNIPGQVGQMVAYVVVIKNTGNVPLKNTGADSGCAKSWENEPLAPGFEQSFNCSYELTEADKTAGSHSNTATNTATPPEGDGPPETQKSNTVVVEPIT
jgi:hypothetical protein